MSRRAAGVPAVASAAAFVALMCASGVARAQFTPTGATDRKVDPEMETRTVRSGLVISLMLGWGISGASGYPNNSNQIGDPAYYSSSNVMAGAGGGLFVGGALADYVNFGFFFASQSFKSHDWQSRNTGFGVRVETFPLVYAVPTLKNLGAYAEFGIGSAKLDVVAPGYPEASGVQSFIGVGVMYEFKIFSLFGGHAVFGPTLEYDNVFSTSISSGAGILGARLAFYGGL
jgi:hypothetical protein